MYRLVLIFTFFAWSHESPYFNHKLTEKIVGGREAKIEEFPYQLSIRKGGSHWCGATLIKPNIAVTASHCVADLSETNTTIRAGTSFRESGGETIQASKICRHPKFDFPDYDIAVIILKKSFPVGPTIQTIPLMSNNVEIPTGKIGTVTGWGNIEMHGPLADVLQTVDVPKIDHDTCVKNYPNENIRSHMMCFGLPEGGKDACHGDSGGPLVVNGQLAGVISWGYGCAFPNLPNVYVKVFDPEISSHINDCINKYGNK